jgi:hypothetical protein
MNLISCENCGIIIDKDRINFIIEKIIENENLDDFDEGYNKDYWAWNSYEEDMVLFIKCPVCKTKIFLTNGDKVR